MCTSFIGSVIWQITLGECIAFGNNYLLIIEFNTKKQGFGVIYLHNYKCLFFFIVLMYLNLKKDAVVEEIGPLGIPIVLGQDSVLLA